VGSDKALVMLSGGLDSATCLYLAKEKYSEIIAITFNYFGRLVQEKHASVRLVKAAGINKLIEVDLPFVKEAGDDNSYYYSGRFKDSHSNALWSSYVPARNMIFYSISAHYAEYLGAKWIVGGHNLHFKEGCLLCDGQSYQIVLPLAEMNRKQIIRLAMELKAPIELTWSCHREGTVHCGTCYSCKQRLEAFEDLGLKDPAFFFSFK
jgi:7-cyano-7-deazaguanine synthase